MTAMNKLNVGSGQRPFPPPWINVDIEAKWKPDVIAPGCSMPMFQDGSADIIILHHVYEHFGLGEARPLVKECHRILCHRGSLIITTPDLRALCVGWLHHMIDEYTFCVNLYGAYNGEAVDRHKWLYTMESLTEAVGSVSPWKFVLPFDWRDIMGANIARDWWILGLEAIK